MFPCGPQKYMSDAAWRAFMAVHKHWIAPLRANCDHAAKALARLGATVGAAGASIGSGLKTAAGIASAAVGTGAAGIAGGMGGYYGFGGNLGSLFGPGGAFGGTFTGPVAVTQNVYNTIINCVCSPCATAYTTVVNFICDTLCQCSIPPGSPPLTVPAPPSPHVVLVEPSSLACFGAGVVLLLAFRYWNKEIPK